VLIK
jgi:hypothetical protein